MSEDYITYRDDQLDRRLYAIFAVNLLIAGLALFGWRLIHPVIAEPLRWGTGIFVAANAEPLEYPINMLWAVPIVTIAAAWILRIDGKRARAVTLASAPLIFLTILVICYHAGLGTFR